MNKSFYQFSTPEEALEIYFQSGDELYGKIKNEGVVNYPDWKIRVIYYAVKIVRHLPIQYSGLEYRRGLSKD